MTLTDPERLQAALNSAADAERLRGMQASMTTGLERFDSLQGWLNRLAWIGWTVAVLVVGGLAAYFLLRSGTGN